MLDGPFGDLAATQDFLGALIQVPLTHFEVLAGGFHCQTLAFQAQEHALVLKISRNGTALFAEQSIREHFGVPSPVPIPAVFFKGHQQDWAWLVQARCQGLAMSQLLTLPRLKQTAQALVALHQWRKPAAHLSAVPIDAQQWAAFLLHLHGFLSEEIRPDTPLSPAVWLRYREAMEALLSVYDCLGEDYNAAVWCWIHGDLKPDHLFVDEAVTGIIDWEMFRPGDFVYDWAVFLLYAPVSEVSDPQVILRCFVAAYEGKGFALQGLNARLKVGILHSALGALFMFSQTQQLQSYQALKLRLDRLLETDFEALL